MSNQVLSSILIDSKKTKKIIGFFEKEIGIDDFCVGYVLDFNDNLVVIQHITKYGTKDGIHIKQISSLLRIETDSDYLKACQTLFEKPELLPKQTHKNCKFPSSDSWQYHFLNVNSCIGELIAFELSGEDYFNFGFLIDFDENNFSVHLVGQSGESQGTNVYPLIDLASLGLDTLQCRKRRLMYDLRKKASS